MRPFPGRWLWPRTPGACKEPCAEGSRAEAVLLSLDFDLLLAEAGRFDDTELLKPFLLERSIVTPGSSEPRIRDLAAVPRAELRREYRLGGHRMKPLPFA